MTINVIAEIGSNWGGDIELAKQHIKKSKDSGATDWTTESFSTSASAHACKFG